MARQVDGPRGYAGVDPVVSAEELTPLIREHANETERSRRLAQPVVDALRRTRLFTMGLPTSLGGAEIAILTALRAIEQIAYAERCYRLERDDRVRYRDVGWLPPWSTSARLHRLDPRADSGRRR